MNLKPYAVALGILASACATQIKPREFYQNRISDISATQIDLDTITIMPGVEEPISYTREGGRGELYKTQKGCYGLTKDHVVSTYTIQERVFTPYGPQMMEFLLDRDEVISEITYLDDIPLIEIVSRREDDIAVFKLPTELEHYCNDLTLDNVLTKDQLYPGMRVFWNGQERYRESHIIKLLNPEDTKKVEDNLDASVGDTFMINTNFINKSSGTYVQTEIDDKIYRIGLVTYNSRGLGGVAFMDPFIEVIKQFEAKQITK